MNKGAITKFIVENASALNITKIDKEKIIISKKLLRDGIGVLLLGMRHETTASLINYFRENEVPNGIPVLNSSLNLNMRDTAFIYGCAIHSMDFEPMFLPPTHVVSPILSPILALAQSGFGSGKLFLTSFMVGVQFEADLRKAAMNSDTKAAQMENHFPFERRGFHPPGTVGPLGSALASSLMLNNTLDKTVQSIGIAASRSSGLSGNIGTKTKALHCGLAARSGLESSALAKAGITSSKTIIETSGGWGEVFGGEFFDYNQLIKGMNLMECFLKPGFAFKKWPAHTAMQVTINTALKLCSIGTECFPITISAPVFKYCDRPFPIDGDEARFSFQYNAVLAILDGKIDNSSYSEQKLNSKPVQNALMSVKLILDSTIPKDFGQMHIVIETNDGHTAKSNTWPGHWSTPMTEEEHLDKFYQCTKSYWTKSKAKQISDHIMSIEKVDNFKILMNELNSL